MLCVYGLLRQAGSTRHRSTTPLSSRVRVRVYWREACLGSNSCLVHNPPLPLFLSVPVHVISVSSLHRNANLAFLFFRIPRSCIKFAFPRARVPKIPGTREHETRIAPISNEPILVTSLAEPGPVGFGLFWVEPERVYFRLRLHPKKVPVLKIVFFPFQSKLNKFNSTFGSLGLFWGVPVCKF